MPVLEHLVDHYELRDYYLLPTSPGVAFHAMLFPGRYPTDRTSIAARIEDPELPSPILESYSPWTLPFLRAGLLIQRLAVLYGPDDSTNFDPEYVRLLQREYTQLQGQEIEEVRVAWFGRFLLGMQDVCGSSSPFVEAYSQGIQEDDPKTSFWATYSVSQSAANVGWQKPTIVSMQYYKNHEFAGATVSSSPFSPHLDTFVEYCRVVYDSSDLSVNISDLPVLHVPK